MKAFIRRWLERRRDRRALRKARDATPWLRLDWQADEQQEWRRRMADLEAVARWHDDEALLADSKAYTAESKGLGVASEWKNDAAMHRAAAAACRELAKRHALPKHKQNAICWEPSMSGLPHDKEVADIVLARRDTDAALDAITEETPHD